MPPTARPFIDILALGFTTLLALIACSIGAVADQATSLSLGASAQLYALICSAYCALYGFCQIQVPPELRRRAIVILSIAATAALAVMCDALVRHLAQVPVVGPSMTADQLAMYSDHVSGAKLSLLSNLHVPEHSQFFMDGGIDRWVFIFSHLGLDFLSYSEIPIQEKGTFYLYTAVNILLGSYHPFHIALANWLFCILAGLLTYALASRYLDHVASLIVSTIILALPENIYFSAILFKDVIASSLILLFATSTLWGTSGRRFAGYILAALAITAMAFVRSGLVMPMIAAGVAIHLAGGTPLLRRLPIYVAVLAATAVAMTALLPADVQYDLARKTVLKVLAKLQGGSSEYLDAENITYTTTFDDSLVNRIGGGDISLRTAYFVPIRVAAYLLAPFPPLSPRFVGDYYIFPSAYLIATFLVPFAFGFIKGLVNWKMPAFSLLIFFTVIGIALSFSGPFVYERYRVLLTPFYFMIAVGAVYSLNPAKRLGLVSASAAVWLLGILAYFWIK